ncbi:hypothetical protein LINPERPRIM_LOCUS16220, partial [Linum perenne]
GRRRRWRVGEEGGWWKVGGGGRTFEDGGEEGGWSEMEGRREDSRRWREEGRTVGGGGKKGGRSEVTGMCDSTVTSTFNGKFGWSWTEIPF